MRRILFVLCVASAAPAYEYRLQFALPSGARNVVVAGYAISEGVISGSCSYTITRCAGRYSCRTLNYAQTCTWDLYGNLLSTVSGAPAAPDPLYTDGTKTVYATDGNSITGSDGRSGFVDTPSSHFTWAIPSGSVSAIPYGPTTVPVTLLSDGDFDLSFAGAQVTAYSNSVYNTAGAASVAEGCPETVPVGSSCTITVVYDPSSMLCTSSPYGYAYTGIDLSLSVDAPVAPDWTETFTVMGLPLCDE
ncbi:MAG TPA: hypothetical protein VG496_12660 [Myxococcales bacterium]|nr:hypothetical protein [Myxococcales bacterium]